MWVLLIVLLAVVPGINQVTVLNTFPTYEACQPERNRIGFEMAEAYPGEGDFLIVCEYRDDDLRIPIRLYSREADRGIGDHRIGRWTRTRRREVSMGLYHEVALPIILGQPDILTLSKRLDERSLNENSPWKDRI